VGIITALISSVKKTLKSGSYPFSILPNTDYRRHVPQNAKQLMSNNWSNTGRSLRSAVDKVGKEIERS
jgi:hypothetical protein